MKYSADPFFRDIETVRFEGHDSTRLLSYRWYDAALAKKLKSDIKTGVSQKHRPC